MKLLLPIFALLFLAMNAHAMSIAGMWKKESFALDMKGPRITGYWGERNYDVKIYYDGYEGEVGGKDIRIDFWNKDVTGNVYCGEVNITAWNSDVEGTVCGEGFITVTGNQGDSIDVARESTDAIMLDQFPSPAHGTLRQHIRWMRNQKSLQSLRPRK